MRPTPERLAEIRRCFYETKNAEETVEQYLTSMEPLLAEIDALTEVVNQQHDAGLWMGAERRRLTTQVAELREALMWAERDLRAVFPQEADRVKRILAETAP